MLQTNSLCIAYLHQCSRWALSIKLQIKDFLTSRRSLSSREICSGLKEFLGNKHIPIGRFEPRCYPAACGNVKSVNLCPLTCVVSPRLVCWLQILTRDTVMRYWHEISIRHVDRRYDTRYWSDILTSDMEIRYWQEILTWDWQEILTWCIRKNCWVKL